MGFLSGNLERRYHELIAALAEADDPRKADPISGLETAREWPDAAKSPLVQQSPGLGKGDLVREGIERDEWQGIADGGPRYERPDLDRGWSCLCFEVEKAARALAVDRADKPFTGDNKGPGRALARLTAVRCAQCIERATLERGDGNGARLQ